MGLKIKRQLIKGYGIKGSSVRGTSGLIFKTKKEAQKFTKKIGGYVIKKNKIF